MTQTIFRIKIYLSDGKTIYGFIFVNFANLLGMVECEDDFKIVFIWKLLSATDLERYSGKSLLIAG